MQTKSNIQLIKEQLRQKEIFKNNLSALMNKYTVEDNFFTMKNDASLNEEVSGYFKTESEYKSLDEAVSNMKKGQAIRIINNETFVVGNVYKKLSESGDGSVYDIAAGNVIE